MDNPAGIIASLIDPAFVQTLAELMIEIHMQVPDKHWDMFLQKYKF